MDKLDQIIDQNFDWNENNSAAVRERIRMIVQVALDEHDKRILLAKNESIQVRVNSSRNSFYTLV